jgi:hypothetical protein
MAITAGLTLACTDGFMAGIKKLYLIDKADLVSFSLASGSTEDYDTCTLGTSKKWWVFDFEEDLAELRWTVEGERGSYKVTIEIEAFIKGQSGTKTTALKQLIDNSPCGFYALVTDNNAITWVVGYNEDFIAGERPLRLASMNATTLKALGEVAGTTYILRCITTEPPYTCSAAIVIT